MAIQNLVSVILVGPLGPDSTSAPIAHGLRSNDKNVIPTLIQPDRASPIVVLAVTDTTVTFKNNGTDVATAYFRCERGLSNEVDAASLPTMYWQGAASGGGGPTIPAGCVYAPGPVQPSIAPGTPVAIVAGEVVPANASSIATAPCMGLYSGATEHLIRTSGLQDGYTPGTFTADSRIYLGVGGGFTAVAPSTSGNMSQYLGQSVGTDALFFSTQTIVVV